MRSSISKPFIGAIVIDPTVLNTRERLTAFLESMIYKKYVAFLPSLVSLSIQKEEWNELTNLLRGWEWNLDRAESEEWFRSSDACMPSICFGIDLEKVCRGWSFKVGE